MTTTTNLGLTLLEVSQGSKEATINEAFSKLDWKAAAFLADAASDPSTTGAGTSAGLAFGTMYYNTAAKVVKILRPGPVWSVMNGYIGEAASDPATTNLLAGTTYFDTVGSKLKVLKSDSTWVNVA